MQTIVNSAYTHLRWGQPLDAQPSRPTIDLLGQCMSPATHQTDTFLNRFAPNRACECAVFWLHHIRFSHHTHITYHGDIFAPPQGAVTKAGFFERHWNLIVRIHCIQKSAWCKHLLGKHVPSKHPPVQRRFTHTAFWLVSSFRNGVHLVTALGPVGGSGRALGAAVSTHPLQWGLQGTESAQQPHQPFEQSQGFQLVLAFREPQAWIKSCYQ